MSELAAIMAFPAVGRIAEKQLSEMDAVASLSDDMLTRVGEGDWDNLIELQARRDDALRACLTPELTGAHSDAARGKIQHLLEQNQRLLSVVNEAKEKLLVEMQQSKQNHRAVSAYLQSPR